jgi:hypothetical protein
MLWYAILTYLVLDAIQKDRLSISSIILMGIVCGLAIATKASSVLYLAVPWLVIVIKSISALTIRMNEISDPTIPPSVLDVQRTISHKDVLSEDQEPTYEDKTQGEAVVDQKEEVTLPFDPTNTISIFIAWVRFFVVVCVSLLFITFIAGITSFIFSPHNFISLKELFGSMHYESDVGLGRYIPFYTRQFLLEYPMLFQAEHIFPFAMGLPMFLLATM